MSLKTWEKQFYPTEAKEFKGLDNTDKEVVIRALIHSLNKWIGLLHLKEHRLKFDDGDISAPDSHLIDFKVDAVSCALCQLFSHRGELACERCPLYSVNNCRCDRTPKGAFLGSQFMMWKADGNPRPMIALILEAIQNELGLNEFFFFQDDRYRTLYNSLTEIE